MPRSKIFLRCNFGILMKQLEKARYFSALGPFRFPPFSGPTGHSSSSDTSSQPGPLPVHNRIILILLCYCDSTNRSHRVRAQDPMVLRHDPAHPNLIGIVRHASYPALLPPLSTMVEVRRRQSKMGEKIDMPLNKISPGLGSGLPEGQKLGFFYFPGGTRNSV